MFLGGYLRFSFNPWLNGEDIDHEEGASDYIACVCPSMRDIAGDLRCMIPNAADIVGYISAS